MGRLPFTSSSAIPTVNCVGDLRHGIHFIGIMQRFCEYGKAIAIYGPLVVLRPIQSSLYPNLLCHRSIYQEHLTKEADINHLDRGQCLSGRWTGIVHD